MDNNKYDNRQNGPGGGNNNGPRNSSTLMIFLVVTLLTLVAMSMLNNLTSDSRSQEITYNQFLAMIDSGVVDTVTIDSMKITVKPKGDAIYRQGIETYYTGLINGEYDILSSAPADYLEELSASDAVTLVEASGATVAYCEFNTNVPFFSDMRVREAVIRAFDRDKATAYENEYYRATHCLIQDNCLNYSKEAEDYYKEHYGYDVDAAKALMADAGWADTDGDGWLDKDGVKAFFTFDSRDTDSAKIVVQSIKEDLAVIGIDMDITTQNWSYVNQDVREGKCDIGYLNLGWSEPMLLINTFCNRSEIAAANSNLDLEGYLELVNQARTTIDYDARTEIITQIQKKLFDYRTIMPLLQATDYRCWSSKLDGIVYTKTGGFWINDLHYAE